MAANMRGRVIKVRPVFAELRCALMKFRQSNCSSSRPSLCTGPSHRAEVSRSAPFHQSPLRARQCASRNDRSTHRGFFTPHGWRDRTAPQTRRAPLQPWAVCL